ncbi:uncharacterized protein LOC132032542 isoform X2 [Lycium ferocissimum]|uniref:uncharacterized protein LOC132032542 isoform X2 n=1 Tax=Lycium ferocissimum TaxID=112874 RepID=UPI0028156F43|nr:uncharacterized protein LOC132032542 isoform X2 [Lycium ferocissimum]
MEAETSAAPTLASAAPVTEETKKKMIMVAIDESEESLYALKWALDHLLTDPSSSTIITLINVQPFFAPMVYPAGPVVFAAPTVVEAVKKAQHENATRILSRALHLCKQKMGAAKSPSYKRHRRRHWSLKGTQKIRYVKLLMNCTLTF